MPADGQPVIIQELAGPRATLVLGGRDRPAPNVGVGSKQRATQKYLPGSEEAVVHIMGTAEDPISLRGRFHDDFLRVFGQSPEDQVLQARGLLHRMNSCRLTWGTSIVRIGRVKAFVPTYVRDKVIDYEITFDVDLAEDQGGVFHAPPGAAAAANIRQSVNTAISIASGAVVVARAILKVGTVIL